MTRTMTLLTRGGPAIVGLSAAGLLASGVAATPGAASQDAPSPQAEKHRPSATPDRIATTIAGDPATSRAVSWRSDDSIATGEAQIAVATDWTQFEDGAETVAATTTPLETDLGYVNHHHTVHFTGLEPDEQYVYRVGDVETDAWSEWTEIETAQDGDEPFDFAFLGDAQNGIEEHFTRVARRSYDMDPDLLVFPGDLVNVAERDQEWGEWLGAVNPDAASVPNLVVPGNHEYYQLGGFRAPKSLTDHWRLQFALPDNGPEGHPDFPGTVYSIDYQGVRFIGLNSAYREAEADDPEGQREFLQAQAQWLEGELQDNPNRWTVVFFHHPTYSTARGKGVGQPEIRELWRPLLEDYGVDLVLSGHDHSYGRGSTDDSRQGRLHTGPVYVNSVSGPKMYELSTKTWTDNGATAVKADENVQLYQHIEVENRTLTFQSFTATGEWFDGFEIKAAGRGGNIVTELDEDDAER